ncbi:DUF7426 family protein [Actinokineospora globicatena]|uniref:DUF7426 domain-containing protein n=1 Tax=Actinokineospora globicatena TaxID=103729 RepID=A0A9W6QNH5_9PSEU|nr:hypothetical protein [Actinokineospora globicatena]GLW91769.1 hypothetical protein Aglo03_25850 [Actinokineospora globicatena]
MTTFPDLTTLNHYQDETGDHTLTLPIKGVNYTWDAGRLPYRTGLVLQRLRAAARALFEAQQEAERTGDPIDESTIPSLDDFDAGQFERDLLGEMHDRLAADAVSTQDMRRVLDTLQTWYLYGEDAALETWKGTLPEADARPPAQGPASTKRPGGSSKRTTGSRSTGAGSSRSGTSSKRASRRSTTST